MDCKNCCYFGYSDDEDWTRADGTKIEHCLFRELRGDYETAPCDEPSYEDDLSEMPSEYFEDDEEDFYGFSNLEDYLKWRNGL